MGEKGEVSSRIGETINMFLTFFLGFILWWILAWMRRRFISPNTLIDDDEHIWSKLPSSNMTDNEKRKTYAEARKKFIDEQKKTQLPFFDETLIHQQVKNDLGHYHVEANEGAFALAEARKKRFDAMKKLDDEKKMRMEEEANNKKNKEETKSSFEEGQRTKQAS